MREGLRIGCRRWSLSEWGKGRSLRGGKKETYTALELGMKVGMELEMELGVEIEMRVKTTVDVAVEVRVTGQTVVDRTMVLVMMVILEAGQEMTVGAQEVMVFLTVV